MLTFLGLAKTFQIRGGLRVGQQARQTVGHGDRLFMTSIPIPILVQTSFCLGLS